MAVVFEGEVKIMLNRHRFMGDGIVLTWPEFLIFLNTGDKYSAQIIQSGAGGLIGTDYPTVTDAYIAAQVHLGKLELKDGMYVPKEKQT